MANNPNRTEMGSSFPSASMFLLNIELIWQNFKMTCNIYGFESNTQFELRMCQERRDLALSHVAGSEVVSKRIHGFTNFVQAELVWKCLRQLKLSYHRSCDHVSRSPQCARCEAVR